MTELNEFLSTETTLEIAKIFSAIEQASFIVSKEVWYQGLGDDIMGARGTENSTGDQQQKLDVYADSVFERALRKSGVIAGWASEESDEIVSFEGNEDASHVIVIDPLDGSSNIDVNVAIGTIFGIYERVSPHGTPVELRDFLQKGRKQVAAGYVMYSVSTQMVLSTGHGVHIFTLEPWKRSYHRVLDHVKMPYEGRVYSINEVNFEDFDEGLKRFIHYCQNKKRANGKRQYTGRYIGSLVADFHRNLLRGGIYVYPGIEEAPNGKIRLLYECNPIAYLAEQSGGQATDGSQVILDMEPIELHQRVPFYVGCNEMMNEAMRT
ncbi:MAG: class 1 fructose-bisphosphatase [Flavobacteriales bacterium]|nr:class 1 fructose-bisphosphatase [Flavobacteriales bacterium]